MRKLLIIIKINHIGRPHAEKLKDFINGKKLLSSFYIACL